MAENVFHGGLFDEGMNRWLLDIVPPGEVLVTHGGEMPLRPNADACDRCGRKGIEAGYNLLGEVLCEECYSQELRP